MKELRIVSLIASSTEIVCALGLRDYMVGRSHECDYPDSIKSLPVCTAPKFNPEGTSFEIDQRVRTILQEALSVYRVDADKLNELKPSHLITQSQCEVCAVSLKDVEEAACQIICSMPQIVSLEPNCLDDIFQDIDRVGTACNVKPEADKLISRLRSSMSAIEKTALSIGHRPRLALVEWIDPLMAGGNWMPELVEMAGAVNLFGENGRHSPYMSWDELKASNPDLIIVAPCGFDVARTLQDMPFMVQRDGWHDLRCVKEGKVFVADGNQYFNRPGPRVLESLEMMSEMTHPEHFPAKHQGHGWIRFSGI